VKLGMNGAVMVVVVEDEDEDDEEEPDEVEEAMEDVGLACA
jgi:hypothetical protein